MGSDTIYQIHSSCYAASRRNEDEKKKGMEEEQTVRAHLQARNPLGIGVKWFHRSKSSF